MIVIDAPLLHDAAGVREVLEPVLVETLVAEAAVEALDIGVGHFSRGDLLGPNGPREDYGERGCYLLHSEDNHTILPGSASITHVPAIIGTIG